MSTLTDTSPRAEETHLALLRQVPVWHRFALAEELTRTTHQLSWEALRRRHPGAPDAELQRRWLEIRYGEALADQVFKTLTRPTAP